LKSLSEQVRQADEVIIVDASDSTTYIASLKEKFLALSIVWMTSEPSVCHQRNIGINQAQGDWIFLHDDDITLDKNYLAVLEHHAQENIYCGALAGQLMQMERGEWISNYPPSSIIDLLWRYWFQLSVWGDLTKLETKFVARPLLRWLKEYYQRKGNDLTKGGWPLVTQDWNKSFLSTRIFSLGANLVRKDWLLRSSYDEVLDPGGIGDNYGVAMGFPGTRPIHVVMEVKAFHHRAETNRVKRSLAYYRRVLALHYFTMLKGDTPQRTTRWLLWSLTGNAIQYLLKGDRVLFRATLKAMKLIWQNKNPYLEGHHKRQKSVQPLIDENDS
jgi:glycosyltransferase involved in cell wall biosynthesis